MLKRLIYIFALCCFVNSAFGCVPGGYCSDMSLLDMLIGQFSDDDGPDNVLTKDVCGHSVAVPRTTTAVRKLSRITQGIGQHIRQVIHVYGNFLIRKPILPAYYNFLFRLSPF